MLEFIEYIIIYKLGQIVIYMINETEEYIRCERIVRCIGNHEFYLLQNELQYSAIYYEKSRDLRLQFANNSLNKETSMYWDILAKLKNNKYTERIDSGLYKILRKEYRRRMKCSKKKMPDDWQGWFGISSGEELNNLNNLPGVLVIYRDLPREIPKGSEICNILSKIIPSDENVAEAKKTLKKRGLTEKFVLPKNIWELFNKYYSLNSKK